MAAIAATAIPRLQEWRGQRFLSPDELAKLAKVSRFTIYHAEQGRRVRLATIRKLAAALDVEPAQLCEEEPDKVAV